LAKGKLDIIFENDEFVAINKPSGMLSIPDRTQSEPSVKDMLMAKYGSIFVVHRIDRETGGLLLFAKNEHTHKYLCQVFETRQVQKKYVGIVLGKPFNEQGLIEVPIAESHVHKGQMQVVRTGKECKTGYTTLFAHDKYSMLQFDLFTGRTHQIRVHCKYIGNPLACDALYGDGKPIFISSVKKNYKLSKVELEEQPIIGSLALHAHTLSFIDEKGIAHNLEAPIPKTFRALVQQMGK
jgi:23S rRNA pseudouridine1911/1915/1917 synthase